MFATIIRRSKLVQMLVVTLMSGALLVAVFLPEVGRSVDALASMGAWGQESKGVRAPGSRGAQEQGGMGLDVQRSVRTGEQGSVGAEEQSEIRNPKSEIASRTIAYTYDDAGRLVAVDYGGGKTIHYTYDNAGNLLQRCTLTADFNPDSNVDIAEVMDIARRWGAGTGEPLYDPAFDLDGNGTIDSVDIQRAAEQWRLC